jgi:hypothetical protein
MNAFLFMLQEHNEHMKIGQRKELLKVYASAAEIFEDALLPFLPKIHGYLDKKLREGDTQLHQVIAESLGALIHHLLSKVDQLTDLLGYFNPVLKVIFASLSSASKNQQIGAAVCLTKVIQSAPVSALQTTLKSITGKIYEMLVGSVCKS